MVLAPQARPVHSDSLNICISVPQFPAAEAKWWAAIRDVLSNTVRHERLAMDAIAAVKAEF